MQAGKHYPHQEHVASYYAATRNDNQQWPELSGELNAEVCIIGGGFTGLNTAINLAEAGYKVVLLEANRIGWGASGRNGGQLIRGIGHDTSQFARWIGEEGVRELDLMGLEAVELVRERIERFNIDCDLRWGYCDLATRQRHLAGFAEEAAHLANLGYRHEVKLVAREDIHSVVGSDRYIGGMIDMGSGHLHPLNLALGEARAAASLGVALFEQSRVVHIDYGDRLQVTTAHGRVSADYLVIGCNAYLNDLNPSWGARCCRRAPTSSPPRCWRSGCASACCRRTWRCAIRTWRSTTTASPPTAGCCLAEPATTQEGILATSRPSCCPSCCGCFPSWRILPSNSSGAA